MLEYRGKRQSLTQWANEYNINPTPLMIDWNVVGQWKWLTDTLD